MSRKSWSFLWGLAKRLAIAAVGLGIPAVPSVRAATPALTWRWSNPLPHGNNIFDMAFHAGTYWQVTDRGQIYWSTNRVTWSVLPSGTTNALRGLVFQGNELLISGAEGIVLAGGVAGIQRQELVPPTAAWLEGIAASATTAVAVGDEGAIYVREGTRWSRVEPPLDVQDTWFRGAAFGNGVFVVVGENGVICTSENGRAWQTAASPVTAHLNRVFFANEAFHACGDEGVLLLGSADGQSWTDESAFSFESLYTYAAQPAQNPPFYDQVFAGIDTLGLKIEEDGPWLDQLGDGSPLPAPVWSYYAGLWDGEQFVVAGRTGMLVEGSRSSEVDATLWFESSDSPRDWLWDVTTARGQYISVGDRGTVLTSPNGIDWSVEYAPPELSGTVFLGVGGTSNVLVAVGSAGGLMYSRSSTTNILITNEITSLVNCVWQTNQVVATNTVDLLGLAWHAVDPPLVTDTLQGVAAGKGQIVVVGDQGAVLTSPDGSTWTSQTIPDAPNLSSVAAYAGGFVAVGSSGAIYQSPDARVWSRRLPGLTNWVYRVRELRGTLLAVGQGGLMLASTNGLSWHPRSTGSQAWLTDVHFAGGRYFTCGTQGTLLTSVDALQWERLEIPTGKSLYGLASADGQLIAIGVEGVILRTILAPETQTLILDYEHNACGFLAHDRFRLRGVPDQDLVAQSSSNLVGWKDVGSLRLSDPEVDFELKRTNAAPPSTEYFRFVSRSP